MRVGIIGAGGIGNVHARQYAKMPDVELFFAEEDVDRAKTFTERWKAQRCTSVDDLLSRCDIADICVQTDLHVDLGLKAIAAGRAVMIEKPIAKNLRDAAQLVNVAAKARVPLGVGQVVRFFPEFREANALVRSGKLGKPAAARTRRGGTAPTGKDNWFMDHSRSGGVIIDLAVHDFDWLRWTLGEVKHLYSRSVGAKTGFGPDYALTTLTFDDGAVGHVEATWMDPAGFRTTLEVCCSEGMVQHDSRTGWSLQAHEAGKSVRESSMAGTDDPYYRQLRAFVDAVRDGKEPPVTGYDGFMALSICLAAIESAKTAKVVRPSREL